MAGFSIRQTGELLKEKILETAHDLTRQMKEILDIVNGEYCPDQRTERC